MTGVMNGKSVALAMALMALTVAGFTTAGWAGSASGLPAIESGEAASTASEAKIPALSDLRAINIFDLEKNPFSTDREAVPAEVVEYAKASLQTNTLLRYDPSATGVLKFQCQDSGCYRIKAELTYGEAGPVLWQSSAVYKSCPFLSFRFQPDSKAFATKMINRLSQDYQKALKASVAQHEVARIEPE